MKHIPKMNTLHCLQLRLKVITLLVCLTMPLMAQSDGLPPLPPGMTYNADGAMVPEGRGGFQPEDSGPPGPPGGGGVHSWGCTNCTNVDYGVGFNLSIALGADSNSVQITMHNTTNGLWYVLQAATNLLGPWYTSQAFLATNVTPNTNMLAEPIALEDYEGLYFRGLQGTPGKLRWMRQLENIDTETNADAFGRGLDAAPSLSPDGLTIYMTTAKRTISAIDAATGIVLWTDSIFTPNASSPETPEFTGSAAVTSSNIYVGSCDGNLYCLNATNGHTNWIKSMGPYTAVYATPSIDTSGRVLVPSDETELNRDGNPITGLTCLVPTATNATVAWFFQPQDLHDLPPNLNNEGDIDSSVAVANGAIYFLAEGWRLYSLDPSGRLNWFIPIQADGEPDDSVAIDGFGRVLTGCNSEYIYCVNPDGSLEWALPGGQAPLNDFGPMLCSPTIGPGNALYTGTGGGSGILSSLDSSGDFNWLATTGTASPIVSSPAVGESNLYFGTAPSSSPGTFFSLNLSNQTLTPFFTNTQPIFSSPLLCPDGSVVYGCEDGFLYCFWGSSLPAGTNAPWPTFHQNAQRTGLQPGTNTLAENCGAPFLFDGTNDLEGSFSFNVVGPTNTSWSVYYSSNLSNWAKLFTNNVMLIGSPGTNTITDDGVLGLSNRFYQLSNSTCCSRAIGFVSLKIQPGTNLIADQFCQVDDGVLIAGDMDSIPSLGFTMNDLNSLFDLNPWAVNIGSTSILEWNGSGFGGDTNGGGIDNPPEWEGAGNTTMLPGTGAFMVNPTGAPYTIWFTGWIRSQQVFSLQAGTNYLSATAPLGGVITSVTGYNPTNGDTVKLWSTSRTNFVSYPYTSGSWGTNGAPVLSVGEGFVLVSTNAHIWTNTWATGVCGDP